MGGKVADILVKIGPVVAIIATILIVAGLGLADKGVKIVGKVPGGLPKLAVPPLDFTLWMKILVPALLISIVVMLSQSRWLLHLQPKNVSVLIPTRNLLPLALQMSVRQYQADFPVTGGFARSVVNFEAGAETPAAGAFTAVGIALVTLFLTPLLFFLPKATLAATIIVAVIGLVDLKCSETCLVILKIGFCRNACHHPCNTMERC